MWRILFSLVAACAWCFALFFGWAFYEFYWRWRDCFNELGRCFDPVSETVATDDAFVWGILSAIAFGVALLSGILGRRRPR